LNWWLCQAGALQRTKCRFYDQAAKGFLAAEGDAAYPTKRLEDAKGQRIMFYATIKLGDFFRW